jgi:RimJ/RimL family protein N-acetyltransferase
MNYTITPAKLMDVVEVTGLRREIDTEGLLAFTNFAADPERWAAHTFFASQTLFAMRDDLGRLHGIAGIDELRKGVLYVWALGTIWLTAESCKRAVDFLASVFDSIFEQGLAHRIECFVMEGFKAGHRVIRRLGFKEEGIRVGAGSNGENVVNYARSMT